MHQKITVRTQRGDICYCIIDTEQDIESQLAQVHGLSAGHGITARMTETQIQLVDYYYNDVIGAHDILSIEKTSDPISLRWNTESSNK